MKKIYWHEHNFSNTDTDGLYFFIAAQIAPFAQPMLFKWSGQLGQSEQQ